jgi:hypothetical protein
MALPMMHRPKAKGNDASLLPKVDMPDMCDAGMRLSTSTFFHLYALSDS